MTRSIIITGSSGGIGLALVKAFKDNGWFVLGIDKAENKELNSQYLCNKFFSFDLALCKEREIFKSLIEQIKDELKVSRINLNGIINNAAVQIIKPFEEISTIEWDQLLAVNLNAPIELSKAFMSDLKRNRGSIINIGSIHSNLTKSFFSSYAVSKGALKTLTKSLAVEFGNEVRVNMIEPAAIETTMLKEGFKNEPKSLELLKKLHPSETIGDPDDVANAAIFLMDPDQKFLNGSILRLTGGIHCKLHDVH